jgi:hypothetical protein
VSSEEWRVEKRPITDGRNPLVIVSNSLCFESEHPSFRMPGMFMRAGAVIAIAVSLVTCSSCTMYSKPKAGFAGATGGEQLERELWNSIKAKDWKTLDHHLAPTFVSTNLAATRDRAAIVEQWKSWDLQSVSLADVQVQSAGADFVVTATVTVTGTLAGQPAPPQPLHTMTVWQQLSKGFVAVAHSDPLP